MWMWWRRLIFRPGTVTQKALTAPDVALPSRRRQRALRRVFKHNEAVCKPPCAGVRLQTLGEVLWTLRAHEWRGGMKVATPLVIPDWVARLHDAGYTEPANLREVDLRDVSLNFANLCDADLRDANLSGCQLVGADLAGALLTRADLTAARLLDTSDMDLLERQRVENENAEKPPYNWVEIKTRNALTWIFRERNWTGLPTAPSGFTRADLRGADLRSLDLGGVDFVGVQLHGAALITLADEQALRKAYLRNKRNIRPPYAGVKIDTHQKLLWIMRERCWQAEGAVEPKAQINLMRADLSGAQLSAASLRYANLTGARFVGADLRKCDLTSAILRDADFTAANLRTATLLGVNAEKAHFDGAQMCGVDARNSKVREAIFSNADLEQALLFGADICGAELRLTNLFGANLTVVRMDEATIFEGAYVNGLTVMGENNWGNISLSSIQWQKAHRLGDEIVPEVPPKSSRAAAKRLRDNTRRAAMRTYRRLWLALRAQGIDGVARRYHLRYERLRRVVLLRESRWPLLPQLRYAFSVAIDAIVGYGEAPVRTFLIYLVSVFAFASVYWKFVGPDSSISLHWPDWLLYSFVTFHGRGLFDNAARLSSAHGWLPTVALMESAFGVALEFIFVAAFTRRFLGN